MTESGAYEINDAIQVVKGQDTGTFGIVMNTIGDELHCWGRCPTSIGAQAYMFIVVKDNAMYIGRGKIRPTLPGEQRRELGIPKQNNPAPVARISARAARNFAPPPIPPNPPQHSAAQAPAPESQMKQESVPGGKIHGAQFGGVDSDTIDLRPKPPINQEPIDPKLLEPSVFKRASAMDLHQQQPQQQEPQAPPPLETDDNGNSSGPGPRRGRQPRFKRGTQTPSS